MANEIEVIVRNKLTEYENQKNNLVNHIKFIRDNENFEFEEYSKGFLMQYGMVTSVIQNLKEILGIETKDEYFEEMQKLFGVGA